MDGVTDSIFSTASRAERSVSREHGAPLGPMGRMVVAAGGQATSVLPVVGQVRGSSHGWHPVVRSNTAVSASARARVPHWQVLCVVAAALLAVAAVVERARNNSRPAPSPAQATESAPNTGAVAVSTSRPERIQATTTRSTTHPRRTARVVGRKARPAVRASAAPAARHITYRHVAPTGAHVAQSPRLATASQVVPSDAIELVPVR